MDNLPYGILWMEMRDRAARLQMLGGPKNPKPERRQKSKDGFNQLGLIIPGLNSSVYPCISIGNGNKKTGLLIAKILDSWPDPVLLAKDNYAKAAVKNMLPLLYD